MAKEQYTKIVESLLQDKSSFNAKFKVALPQNFSQPNPASVKTLLAERGWQRKCIFWFSIGWASISLIFLIALIGVQSYARLMFDAAFTIFDGSELQIIVVSVFGQILGIIYLIASKVWDNKDYLHFYRDTQK